MALAKTNEMSAPLDLGNADRAYNLHPYANARRHEAEGAVMITRGEGVYVYDDAGKRYLEGLAGLWSAAVGFSEPRLAAAAARQFEALPYYHVFGQKTHPAVTALSARLVELTPPGLNRIFYTNSGSEANDTVVKLLRFRNNALGRPEKKIFISRQRAYHGVTVAAGSLTGLPTNHRDFDLPIAGVTHVSCPHYWRNALPGESEAAFTGRLAQELEDTILSLGRDRVAAFIGEPIMGAGGVILPPEGYWPAIQRVCRKYDVLLVIDEIITGFGRTGYMFASDYFGIEPDVLVMSKQLTSSYQPLAAIAISDGVYDPIADHTAKLGTLGHGFTASGHPVATAVALENLAIIAERGLVRRAARLAPVFQQGLRRFADHPLVGEVRGVGLIAGVELVADKATKAPFEASVGLGQYVAARCQARGLIIRAIGETIAFCPPLIITEEQIGELLASFAEALDDARLWIESAHRRNH